LYKGWYGDSAFTAPVGKVSKEIKELLKVGEQCLFEGINTAKAHCKVGDISNAVQSYAEKRSYNVVRDFVGHGIGKALHEDPQVPNFGAVDTGSILRPGAVIAIEPMISSGTCETIRMEDNWTVKTVDGEPAVHFEHTIVITEKGPEILTLRD
jgi:methionyl aminopeptidase